MGTTRTYQNENTGETMTEEVVNDKGLGAAIARILPGGKTGKSTVVTNSKGEVVSNVPTQTEKARREGKEYEAQHAALAAAGEIKRVPDAPVSAEEAEWFAAQKGAAYNPKLGIGIDDAGNHYRGDGTNKVMIGKKMQSTPGGSHPQEGDLTRREEHDAPLRDKDNVNNIGTAEQNTPAPAPVADLAPEAPDIPTSSDIDTIEAKKGLDVNKDIHLDRVTGEYDAAAALADKYNNSARGGFSGGHIKLGSHARGEGGISVGDITADSFGAPEKIETEAQRMRDLDRMENERRRQEESKFKQKGEEIERDFGVEGQKLERDYEIESKKLDRALNMSKREFNELTKHISRFNNDEQLRIKQAIMNLDEAQKRRFLEEVKNAKTATEAMAIAAMLGNTQFQQAGLFTEMAYGATH